MEMRFFVIFAVVLFSASAEDYYPYLRKVSRRKSNEGDSRVLHLLDKGSKRPSSANIVYIEVPTTDSFTPSTPPEPPRPSKKPSYSHDYYPPYPFVHPILLPVPGWTGNPPPPYVPPSHGNSNGNSNGNTPGHPSGHPGSNSPGHSWHWEEGRPIEPPYDEPVGISSVGTVTTASDGTSNDDWFNRLQPASSVLANRRKPSRKPSRKPTTEKPEKTQVNRKKKPRPTTTRRPRPSKKPTKTTTTTTEKPSEGDVMKDEEVEDVFDEDLLVNRKKKPKPKPSRPRPSKKPTTTTTTTEKSSEGDAVEEEAVVADAEDDLDTKPRPVTTERPSETDVMKDEEVEEQFEGELEEDTLANRKKRPRPSRKPQQKPKPSKKPVEAVSESPDDLTVDEPPTEEPVTQPQAAYGLSLLPSKLPEDTEVESQDEPIMEEDLIEVDADELSNRKKRPRPSKKPKPSKKPEATAVDEPVGDIMTAMLPDETRIKPETADVDDADSLEWLGPDEELIVVQRKGKPMKLRRRTNPWRFFKLPVDNSWQRSEQRPGYFFLD